MTKTIQELHDIAKSLNYKKYDNLSKSEIILYILSGIRPSKSVLHPITTYLPHNSDIEVSFDEFDPYLHQLYVIECDDRIVLSGISLNGRFGSCHHILYGIRGIDYILAHIIRKNVISLCSRYD